jgi:hypothetical protein
MHAHRPQTGRVPNGGHHTHHRPLIGHELDVCLEMEAITARLHREQGGCKSWFWISRIVFVML